MGVAMTNTPKEDLVLVYTAFITLRNGRRLWAWEKGKRCFVFWAPRKQKPRK